MSWDDFLNYELFALGSFRLLTGNLFFGIIVLIGTWLFLVLLRRAITRPRFMGDKFDSKRRLSIYLILKYFIWIISIVIFLETIGVELTVLLVGSTALLVGLGLGLQDIFRDIVSGFFLLFEGSIKIGDILEVDGVVGRVKEMNLRSTELMTRDDMTIIMPNSRFVAEKVVNWSHNYEEVRFSVRVRVEYGSDVEKVISILKDAMNEIFRIETKPSPFVRFIDFGDSSIVFEMIFWTKEPFIIENIKSDLRILVYKKLKENGITIPFPQREISLKGMENVLKKSSD
jgi:small-conductance mechanosensitive channel